MSRIPLGLIRFERFDSRSMRITDLGNSDFYLPTLVFGIGIGGRFTLLLNEARL